MKDIDDLKDSYKTTRYKAFIEKVIAVLTQMVEDEFGESEHGKRMIVYALKDFVNSDAVKPYLNVRNNRKFIASSYEQWMLTLRVLKEKGYLLEYLIIKLMGEGNIELNSLAYRGNNKPYISTKDLYNIGDNYYLNIRTKNGERKQIKLKKDTASELLDYLKATASFRGENDWLFVADQGALNNTYGYKSFKEAGILTYPAFFSRWCARVKPLIYQNNCVHKRVKVTPIFFKGALDRMNGVHDNFNSERAV
jgi:hypothetical protein